MIIAVGNDAQFARLCEYLGEPALATNPSFSTNAARVNNREGLIPLLSRFLAGRLRIEVLEAMEQRGIPAGPVNTVAEAFADPQVMHRRMRVDVSAIQECIVPGVRTPIQFSDAKLLLERSSPRLGEHTDEIVAELGLRE